MRRVSRTTMLISLSTSLIFAQILAAAAFNLTTDTNCRGFETAIGTKVECVYRRGQVLLNTPPMYTNMVMTIISPSGGASLTSNNATDDATRGKGAKIVLKVSDNVPKTGLFTVLSLVNGASASLNSSGRNPQNLRRPAGSGGSCPAGTTNRYAGAGGERSRILFYADAGNLKTKPTTSIHIGGGGGAGATLNGGFTKGGDAGLLDRHNNLALKIPEGHQAGQEIIQSAAAVISAGKSGSPPDLGGQGGEFYDTTLLDFHGADGGRGRANAASQSFQGDGQPGLLRKYVQGREVFENLGHGGSLSPSEGLTYCLAGGGAGDGYYRGGGGGAYAIYGSSSIPYASGGGGGGSSELNQINLQMYEIIHQENVYDPNPRIIFTFDIPAPHIASASASSLGERKGDIS